MTEAQAIETERMQERILHNRNSRLYWEELYHMPMLKLLGAVSWSALGSMNNWDKDNNFVCVECGGSVTMNIINYFRGEPERIRCYRCQGMEETTQSPTPC